MSMCFLNSQRPSSRVLLVSALEALTMQEALVSPANAGRLRSALELKPFAFGDQRLASPRYLNLNLGGADDALFRCSSPTFSPSFGFSSSPSPLATSSVSLSPTSSASLADDGCDGADADAATGHTLRLARLALQYQDVADRYELCLARLADAADDAAALRRENAELRNANADLTRRLALLSGIGKQVAAAAAAAEEARRLRFGEPKAVPAAKDCATEKPAVLPPKSISVRSNDYLKMNQPQQVQAPATPAEDNRKPRASNPTTNRSSVSSPSSRSRLANLTPRSLASDIVACTLLMRCMDQQRVYKGNGGDRRSEEPKEQRTAGGVELEVYNQGMLKTELCNKWEETGTVLSLRMLGEHCRLTEAAVGSGGLRASPTKRARVGREG